MFAVKLEFRGMKGMSALGEFCDSIDSLLREFFLLEMPWTCYGVVSKYWAVKKTFLSDE